MKLSCQNLTSGKKRLSPLPAILLHLLLCVSLLLTIESITAKNLTIYKTPKAPKIDGSASEWKGNWINLTENTFWSTTQDMTAKFKLAYDDNYLYFVAEVKDNTPNNDVTAIPYAWERDCIELYFSMDTASGEEGLYKEGVWQIRKQRNPEVSGIDGNCGKVGGGDLWDVSGLTSNTDFKMVSSGSANPYIIEAQLPWKSLIKDLQQPWDGKYLKFDVSAVDNTMGTAGARTQLSFWNSSTDEQWHNTKYFGSITLDSVVKPENIIPPDNDNFSAITISSTGKYTISNTTKLFDSGGKYYNYSNDENSTITVYPDLPTKKISVSFLELKLENCCDKIYLYDGENTSTPLMATSDSLNFLDEFITTNKTGAITISFVSDGSVTADGFKAILNPILPFVNPHIIKLNDIDTVANFSINAPKYSWAISEDCVWFNVNKTIGNGRDSIKLSAKINTTVLPRTAILKITFTDSLNNASVSEISVQQAASDFRVNPVDTITHVSWNVANYYATEIISNTTCYIYSSDINWLTCIDYSVTGNAKVKILVQRNPFCVPREAFVYLSWYDRNNVWKSKQVKIIQAAAPTGISTNQIEVGASDTSKFKLAITVENATWKLTTSEDWIDLKTISGNKDSSLTISVKENPYAYQRYGYIMAFFKGVNYSDSIKIEVKQKQSPAWIEAPDTIYLSKDDSTILELNTNAYWYMYFFPESSWLKYSFDYPTLGSKKIKLTSERNPYTFSRVELLHLTTYEYPEMFDKTICVIQNAANIGVSTTQLTMGATEGSTVSFNLKSDSAGWKIDCLADWLSIDPMSGSKDITVNAVASENKSALSRNTVINFTAYDGIKNKINIPINVVQKGCAAKMVISKDTIRLTDKNNAASFTITSNTKWIISADSWMNSSFSGEANGNKTININTSYKNTNLSGYVTIYWYSNDTWNTTRLYVSLNSGSHNIDKPGYLSIYKTDVAPTIDGNANINEVWNKIPATKIEKTIDNTSGISAEFKMCYDSSNIYILVNVNDSKPYMEGSMSWQSDAVELYFAMDTVNTWEEYYPGDWFIRKVVSKSKLNESIEGNGAYIFNSNSWNLKPITSNPNFKLKQTFSTTSYSQEWQIPVDSLVQTAKFNAEYFRFDIHVADNNGSSKERTGKLCWNSTIESQAYEVQGQGYIKMAGSIDKLPGISRNLLMFSARSDRMDTVFIYAQDNFTVKANQDWIHVDYHNAGTSRFLTVKVDNSTDLVGRDGSITLNSTDKSYTVSVMQYPNGTIINNVENELSIYPNPVSDILNISSGYSNHIRNVEIFNLDGKLIYNALMMSNSSQINFGNYSPGVYLIQVTFGNNSILHKQIIKK